MDTAAPRVALENQSPQQSLDERAAIDLNALSSGRLVLVMRITYAEAWSVLMALQLACKHPEFQNNPARWLSEQFAHQIQAAVATTPALRDFAEREWEKIRNEAVRRCRVCGALPLDRADLCSACKQSVEEGAPK
jgi:hypothetical protein